MTRIVLALVFVVAGAPHARADRAPRVGPGRVLRVCADPNNFPFSGREHPGFENAIATVLATELGARVEYTWWAERRGFFRNTLKARTCDVVIGVPTGLGMVRATAPYYRSSFAFVTRADRELAISSLDDPRLRTLRVGVQLVGDDGVNPPPSEALARRGIIDNVTGYSVIGDYAKDSPPADVVRAVVDGRIDVAIVWGPLAGGVAARSATPLAVIPVAEQTDGGLPFAFDIGLGVRRPDAALAAELERALVVRAADITKILDAWHIPRVPRPPVP